MPKPARPGPQAPAYGPRAGSIGRPFEVPRRALTKRGPPGEQDCKYGRLRQEAGETGKIVAKDVIWAAHKNHT
jgi:hypothetical protein